MTGMTGPVLKAREALPVDVQNATVFVRREKKAGVANG
jgi:hypothetical protein